MRRELAHRLFGPVMGWTAITTIFAWLPLVRILGRPEGYEWAVLGISDSPEAVWLDSRGVRAQDPVR